MKAFDKVLLLIGIIGILISGCEKDSNNSNNNSGALSGNTLKGKISDWTMGSGKTLRGGVVDSWEYNLVGEASISSDGSFTLNLENPPASFLEPISDLIYDEFTYSDPSTQCSGPLHREIYDSASYLYLGYLHRVNSFNNEENGFTNVDYIFASKITTVNGNVIDSSEYEAYSYTWNLSLKAGWNTIAYQTIDVITNANYTTYKIKVSNSEPSSVKWMIEPY
jgi:hypothetical protein